MTAPVLDLDALARETIALGERADPEPWKLWGGTVMRDPVGDSNVETAIEICRPRPTTNEYGALRCHNAALIAAYRTSAPALARALLAAREAMREASALAEDDRHHVRLLGQALGLMLHKAGVVNPGMALTGPQLLLAVEEYLGVTIEVGS